MIPLATLAIATLCLLLLIVLSFRNRASNQREIISEINELIKTELTTGRMELSAALKENREENGNTLDKLNQKIDHKLSQLFEIVVEPCSIKFAFYSWKTTCIQF